MLFNPVELYDFASQLQATNQKNEAVYRTIINRAYYCAFLSAREFSAIKNASGSVHRDVLNYFKKRHKNIFNQLELLLKLRTHADYVLDIQINRREAGESLRLAKEILTALNYLPYNNP